MPIGRSSDFFSAQASIYQEPSGAITEKEKGKINMVAKKWIDSDEKTRLKRALTTMEVHEKAARYDILLTDYAGLTESLKLTTEKLEGVTKERNRLINKLYDENILQKIINKMRNFFSKEEYS